MSEFVNYLKRGVELPIGCKDLIDVLPPGEAACFPAEGLARIEHHVSRLLQSLSRGGSVWINVIAAPITLGLVRRKGALMALTFVSKDRQQQVSSILHEAGIQPTQDDGIKGPPFTRFFFFVLAADAASATWTVSKLLREGFGLPENVHLEFRYREKIAV